MTPDTKVADGIAELHEQAEPGQVWPAINEPAKVVFRFETGGATLSRANSGGILIAQLKDEAGQTAAMVGGNPFGREFEFELSPDCLEVPLTDAEVRDLIGATAVASIENRVKDSDPTPFECEPLAAIMRKGMAAKHEDWKKNHREADIKANAEYEAKRAAEKSGPIVDKLDARAIGIKITNCGACDGTHEDVKVMEFTRPAGPFTHWFTCPTTNDPVNVTLGLLSNGEGLQLDGPILQNLAKAQLAGMYVVVICYVDPTKNGAMSLHRTTHKFLSSDVYETKEHKGFMGMLRENLEKEFGQPQPVEMRQVTPRPLRDLMGNLLERAADAQQSPAANLGDRVSEAMQTLPPD